MKISLILALVACVALAACSQPGQPANAGNLIVGTTEIIAGDLLIEQANAKLASAYQSGKITTAQYQALYAEEQAAITAINNLGLATQQNQPVTQAQINAAVDTFIVPLAQLVPTTLPAPVTTQPAK